jgi:uncharacterized protein YecE (DUF72 family)
VRNGSRRLLNHRSRVRTAASCSILLLALCVMVAADGFAQTQATPTSVQLEEEKLERDFTDPLSTLPQLILRDDYTPANYGPASSHLALEFRDRSCFGSEMLDLLRSHHATLVISQSSKYPLPETVATSDFGYFRFHGPREMFASSYSDADLERWANKMNAFLSAGHDVYAYFNNDSGGHAPRNAQVLIRKLQSLPAVPSRAPSPPSFRA